MSMIGVIGAGAWGTALANAAARAGRPVLLQARNPAIVAEINDRRSNIAALPGCRIEDGVRATTSLDEVTQAEILLLVIPTQSLRSLARDLKALIRPGQPLVICAKGIERGTGAFVSDIITQELPQALPAILSGPSFADDVVKGLPTAVTLACADEAMAQHIAHQLGSSRFRLYHSDDVRGAEIGGAAKNVLAIAAGIVAGRGLGASAAAALTSRGFAELSRFGRHFGARAETLTGLSGLGDLILSCSSSQSRNFALGHALGRNEAAQGKLAEGAFTASALVALAQQHKIDMPIAQAVHKVLEQVWSVDEAIAALLNRPQKAETET